MPILKKMFCWILSVLTLLSFSACSKGDEFITKHLPFADVSQNEESMPQEKESMELACKLTVIFTSGVCKNLEKAEGVIPLSRIVGLKNSLEMQGEEVILMDTGGSFWSAEFTTEDNGASAARLLKESGYSVSALAESDFNLSAKRIRELSKNENLEIMCSNLIEVKENKPFSKGGILINKGGRKIGILAFSPIETQKTVDPINFNGGVFEASPSILQLMVNNLKENGADYIIALTSLKETDELSPLRLTHEVEGIDLILGEGVGDPKDSFFNSGGTLAAFGDSSLKTLGVVEIDSDKKTANVLSYNMESAELLENDDIETADAVSKIIETQKMAKEEIICKLLFRDKESENNSQNALCSMAAASMRPVTGAVAAMVLENSVSLPIDGTVNSESIHEGINKNSKAVTLNLTGAEIKEVLEENFTAYDEESILPLYFSGITFNGNPKGIKGERISEIKINGESLDLDKSYLVAVDSEALEEESQHSAFKNKEIIDTHCLLSEAVMRYMRAFNKNGNLTIGVNRNITYSEDIEEVKAAEKEKPPEAKPQKKYKVRAGDSLTKISKTIYGTTEYWKEIYELNRDILKSSNNITIGMELKLPEIN